MSRLLQTWVFHHSGHSIFKSGPSLLRFPWQASERLGEGRKTSDPLITIKSKVPLLEEKRNKSLMLDVGSLRHVKTLHICLDLNKRGSNLWICSRGKALGYRAQAIGQLQTRPQPSRRGFILSAGRCDVMTDRAEGMWGMQSPPQPSWPLFLSATWPLVALKLRIKGHRKLPELILEWHVDGLGRPHQHLHYDATASVTGQDRSGKTNGRVTARGEETTQAFGGAVFFVFKYKHDDRFGIFSVQ